MVDHDHERKVVIPRSFTTRLYKNKANMQVGGGLQSQEETGKRVGKRESLCTDSLIAMFCNGGPGFNPKTGAVRMRGDNVKGVPTPVFSTHLFHK